MYVTNINPVSAYHVIRNMTVARRRSIAIAVDLGRPVRSDEFVERVLRATPGLSARLEWTDLGPLLSFRRGQRTFRFLGELIDHLRHTEYSERRP